MNTLLIDIINPKAGKLLKNLVELDLISIRTKQDDGFLEMVHAFRNKAKKNPPTLATITKEVETVRASRNVKTK